MTMATVYLPRLLQATGLDDHPRADGRAIGLDPYELDSNPLVVETGVLEQGVKELSPG